MHCAWLDLRGVRVSGLRIWVLTRDLRLAAGQFVNVGEQVFTRRPRLTDLVTPKGRTLVTILDFACYPLFRAEQGAAI